MVSAAALASGRGTGDAALKEAAAASGGSVAQALTLYARLSNTNRLEATNRSCEPEITTVTFSMQTKPKRSKTVSARRPAMLTTP